MELCIGTIQIGMQFGAFAKSRVEADKMLEYALSHGIRSFNTANAYDELEKALAPFIKKADRKTLNIITRIRPGALFSVAPEDYYKTLKQNIKRSLSNLGVREADGCLFHNGEYAQDEAALEALARLKSDRLTKKTGISVSTPAQFDAVSHSPHVDIIQIPYNILDTRMDARLAKCKKEIHARNITLQGLLLLDESEVPRKLRDAQPIIHRLDSFCEFHGVSRLRVLLNFAKTQPRIGMVVFSPRDLTQLKQGIRDFEEDMDHTALRELADEFAMTAQHIVEPSLWQGEYR